MFDNILPIIRKILLYVTDVPWYDKNYPKIKCFASTSTVKYFYLTDDT